MSRAQPLEAQRVQGGTVLTLDELRRSPSAAVTIKDAAGMLGVNPRTLSAALVIHGGTIPALLVGRRVVIPREAFLAWLEVGVATPPAAPLPVEGHAESSATVASIRTKLVQLLSELESAQ